MRDLRRALIKKHGNALAKNEVTRAKMCDWGVERLDKAEKSIKEHEHSYQDAVMADDDQMAMVRVLSFVGFND